MVWFIVNRRSLTSLLALVHLLDVLLDRQASDDNVNVVLIDNTHTNSPKPNFSFWVINYFILIIRAKPFN